MIIALAGRRVDAPDAKDARFPLQNVAQVRERVSKLLKTDVAAVVSSAACGADLIAQSEAGTLGLRRRVVLPFARQRFRETSVVDRPGDWGPVYDRVIDEVAAAGDLVVLPPGPDDQAYAAANHAILEEALALARTLHQPVKAILVWDGASRGDNDLTEAFGTEARKRGLAVTDVPTL